MVSGPATAPNVDANTMRLIARLRRELRRVAAREHFPTTEAQAARAAVDALANAATGAAA